MRLRRAVQALLRRRRIDEREASYQDIVWENAMEAYESTPDPDVGPVVDMTPYIQARLDAAKEELLLKANRNKRQRDLRRQQIRKRLLVGTATMVMAVTGVGGAAAITDTSTGLAALDDLLGVQRDGHSGGDLVEGRPSHAPDRAEFERDAGEPYMALSVEPEGVDDVLASSYVSKAGFLCMVVIDVATADGQPPVGSGGCLAPGALEREIAERTAFVSGTKVRRQIVATGFAAKDVESLTVEWEGLSLEVDLGDVISVGKLEVRPFLAALATPGPVSEFAGAKRALDPRSYDVVARLQNGDVVAAPARQVDGE